MNFSLFIARRIYGERSGGERFSRPAIRIAMAGIAIGLLVMIVSIAVVLGFKREVSGKVIGFGAHVQVLSMTMNQQREILPVVTNDSLKQAVLQIPGVLAVQEFATKSGMLKTDDDFRAVQFKGIGADYDISFFEKYLVEGAIPNFSEKTSSSQLLISKLIADNLHLQVGDRIFAYFVGQDDMRARRFTVTGIYETHLSEYDKVMCVTNISTVRKLNAWKQDESTGLEIFLDDFTQVDASVNLLSREVNHTIDRIGAMRAVFSIRDLAPHIFSWLDVLDTNVVMILVLMLLIGSFTIVSGILIVMLERIQMIGVLKALGATNKQIRRIFQHFSVLLVGQGMLIGDVAAIVLCFVQQHFGIIALDPDTYYIDSVPILFRWDVFCAVNIGTLLISSLVIFGASHFISIKGPATTIRWE